MQANNKEKTRFLGGGIPKTGNWLYGVGTFQESGKDKLGFPMTMKEPPPTLQRLGCRPRQATPSHPDAGERRGCGEWRVSKPEPLQNDRRRG